MKEDNRHQETIQCPVCLSNAFLWLLVTLLALPFAGAKGQCVMENNAFLPGERLQMDVYFKWGLIMPKAGNVELLIDNAVNGTRNGNGQNGAAYRYRLLFKTTSMFDHIFKMRDTIDCHYSKDMQLLRSEKRVSEGGKYLVDDLKFTYNEGLTRVRSLRYNLEKTKIDTVLVSEDCMTDMLGATLFLRTHDISAMRVGDVIPFRIAVGRDRVNVRFRYAGQSIVEHGDNVKFKTKRFYMDIFDEAFTETKEAIEVWVSDDGNKIPIKIKAKLKIGSAEVKFRSISGNRHPLTSRIVIPSR
ncbi:hypothetical protein A9168_05690 [Macellibacteroides sp. HH-ZS]|nr:hypothetical protein A9168_05690 [Macellibacteroides sp. HH-ZS]